MKTLELSAAASHIKQACDDTGSAHRSPFFFLVGAGISHPSIPLASYIEEVCRTVATKYKRLDEPLGTKSIDTYSHWMGTSTESAAVRAFNVRRSNAGGQSMITYE